MKLKEACFERGFTQFDLHLVSNINVSKISHFENGYILPNRHEVQRIAKALDLNPQDLTFEIKEVCRNDGLD